MIWPYQPSHSITPIFSAVGDYFQSHVLKGGGIRKTNALKELKGSCQRYFPRWLTIFVVKKDFVKQNMALRAQFQMLILTLHPALHICSTPDLNLVQVLVPDLLLRSLLKVKSFSDVIRCYVQCIYIKKEKIKLFMWLIFFITFYTT